LKKTAILFTLLFSASVLFARTEQLNRHLSSVNLTNAIPISFNSASSKKENPYNRAIGQRVAGFVLVGTGLLNFLLAVPVGNIYNDIDGSGDTWTTLIFVEGGFRTIIGGALAGVGFAKYSKWQNWEREHAQLSIGANKVALNIQF
jgi:hypothetical protein